VWSSEGRVPVIRLEMISNPRKRERERERERDRQRERRMAKLQQQPFKNCISSMIGIVS